MPRRIVPSHLTWSGRAAENAGLLKRQHRSRARRRFPEDALVANVGCRRTADCRTASSNKPVPPSADLRTGTRWILTTSGANLTLGARACGGDDVVRISSEC